MSSELSSPIPRPQPAWLAVKRLLDVLVCTMLLLFLLPLLAVVALVVKLSSPGPVFFVQERVGMNGRPFRMLKYRTMTGAPRRDQTTWTEAEESRITAVGRRSGPL